MWKKSSITPFLVAAKMLPRRSGGRYEAFFAEKLTKKIWKAMRVTYPCDEIEVELEVPIDFFLYLTQGWSDYTPQNKRRGVQHYRKCSDIWHLWLTLPRLNPEKQLNLDVPYVTELQCTRSSPVRAIWMSSGKLILNFFHQPSSCQAFMTEERYLNWEPARRVERKRPRIDCWCDQPIGFEALMSKYIVHDQ